MKKSLSFALAYLYLVMLYTATAQDFNKFSIEPEIGFTKIRDITQVKEFNIDLGARYMFNELFGVKGSINRTQMTDYDFNTGAVMGVINMGRLLKFETFTDYVTILGGVGGVITGSEYPTNDLILFRNTNFHLGAFADIEYKLSDRVFARTGIDLMTGVNLQRNTPIKITETTTILNFNVGLTIAIGKSKDHADWFIREPDVNIIKLQPTIIDKTVTEEITKYVTNDCDCSIQRYLYFDHDSYAITKDALEAIEYSKDEILNGKEVTIKAYCSNVGSIEYNKALAWKRAISVAEALIGLGVDSDLITIEPVGIDTTRYKEVFAFGRRVELKAE